MKTAIRRHIPFLVVASVLVVLLFVFGSTNLRFYFQGKMKTALHIANTTDPTVSCLENGFSFEFNVERANEYRWKTIGQVGGKAVSIRNILMCNYGQDDYRLDDGAKEIQMAILINLPVNKTEKGIAIASPVPLPDSQNFYQGISTEGKYEGETDNITVSIGDAQFHPAKVGYWITQYDRGGDLFLLSTLYVFANPDDFTNYIVKPQVQAVKVTVSKLYVHEYELSPILKGVF